MSDRAAGPEFNEATDIIGGFPTADPNCDGCGRPLLLENAWMTDGCPCNARLGVNSHNETRWRLLMHFQQKQSIELERAKVALTQIEELSWGGKAEGAIHMIATEALRVQ